MLPFRALRKPLFLIRIGPDLPGANQRWIVREPFLGPAIGGQITVNVAETYMARSK